MRRCRQRRILALLLEQMRLRMGLRRRILQLILLSSQKLLGEPLLLAILLSYWVEYSVCFCA